LWTDYPTIKNCSICGMEQAVESNVEENYIMLEKNQEKV
jgi:hypothetical protein